MAEIIIQQDMARRYFIETWGCQMNAHDTEKMAGSLLRQGYAPTSEIEDADLVILSANPLETPDEELQSLSVIATWRAGQPVDTRTVTMRSAGLTLKLLWNMILGA